MSEARKALVPGHLVKLTEISGRVKVGAGIALAIALRLVLMPISLHGDIFFIHSLPPVILSEGVWNIFNYFTPFGIQRGYIHYAPLVGYITALSEYVCSCFSTSFYTFIVELPKLFVLDEGVGTGILFAQYPLASRLLFAFLMKSSYFFFDLVCGVIIYFAYRQEKNRAWFGLLCAWMFHPVLLYGTYIFGQHRIYSAMFVWLTILLIKKDRPVWACFAFGWILLLDNYGFIVFLPFITAMAGSFKQMFKYALVALVPFALVLSRFSSILAGMPLMLIFRLNGSIKRRRLYSRAFLIRRSF